MRFWGLEGRKIDANPARWREEYEAMAEVLRGLQGRFILSINDVPAIRRTFAGFRMEPVRLSYSLPGNDNARPARELLISGLRRPRGQSPTGAK